MLQIELYRVLENLQVILKESPELITLAVIEVTFHSVDCGDI